MSAVKGYRELSEEEISLMNEGKALATKVGEYIDKLNSIEATDKRWVAISKTELQVGFMSIIRAVAQPETF